MVDEITPDFIKDLPIPVPHNRKVQQDMIDDVLQAAKKRVESMQLLYSAQKRLDSLLKLRT